MNKMQLKIIIDNNEELNIELNSDISKEINKIISWCIAKKDKKETNKNLRIDIMNKEQYTSCYYVSYKNGLIIHVDNFVNNIYILLSIPTNIKSIFIRIDKDSDYISFKEFINMVSMTYECIYKRENLMIQKYYIVNCNYNNLIISYTKKIDANKWKFHGISIKGKEK